MSLHSTAILSSSFTLWASFRVASAGEKEEKVNLSTQNVGTLELRYNFKKP